MLSTPFLETEAQLLDVSDRPYQGPAILREERFDRITRTTLRLLDAPIAFIAVSEEDAQCLRSVQGLPVRQVKHALAFCDPEILGDSMLMIPDAIANPLFWHNPLVNGPAHVRSYLGVPLSRGPGLRSGSLCAMHTEPRAFQNSDVHALQDLARMVEAELKLDALNGVHKRVMTRLGQLERGAQFNPATGCWTVRRFREALVAILEEAQATGAALALCYVRVHGLKAAGGANDPVRVDTIRQFVAQVLRQRLPEGGALAALGGGDFCAVLTGPTLAALNHSLEFLQQSQINLDVPGLQLGLSLDMSFGLARLQDMGPAATATEIWVKALASLGP